MFQSVSKASIFSRATGLVLGFATLALAVAVAANMELSRRQNSELIRHTLRIQNGLHQLFAYVEGSESSERGYLISNDETYLGPYEDARHNLKANIDEVLRLVADNPEHSKHTANLVPLINERMALIGSVIEEIHSGKTAEAANIVKTGRGRVLMDQIRADISDMISIEHRELEKRETALASATRAVDIGVLLLTTILLILAAYAVGQAQQQSNALLESSKALQVRNDRLLEEIARREEIEAKLRQSQKLEAIGQLTGGIAHDFNNMLSVVIASLNLLKRRFSRGEGGYDRFIDSAVEAAERAANLTHRLLAFSRTQPLAPSPIDANEFVAGISNLLRSTLGEHIHLETSLAKDLWLTKADPNELENAILNLAVNSRDAMERGGRLTIETSNCLIDRTYAEALGEAKPGQYVQLIVTDTGSGMSPEVVARVFDPFFTTKAIGKGTGLGLSQVYGFVKQSGGNVSIYSEVGRGTTIKLYLPRYVGEDEERSAQPANSRNIPTGTPDQVVLIVEDDKRARDVAVECVRELGYTALESDNASAALKILADRPDVRLLMTDVVMPGDDGRKLAAQARREHPNLKILLMSGYLGEATKSGEVGHVNLPLLPKPFTLEQAARKIRDALDH